MYDIDTHYLEHEGGTKFYETVLIREKGGPGLLIKRWGAIALKNGGGQTKYERGGHAVVENELAKILNEKRRKGYRDAPMLGGLHMANGGRLITTELLTMLRKHYGADTVNYIGDYFGLNHAAPIVNEEPVSAEPEVQPERDDRWGSW